jgi:hypothetical protein
MLAVGLLLAGWGMLNLARAGVKPQLQDTSVMQAASESAPCGFGLKLSAVAELVELKRRDGRVLFRHENASGPFTGMIQLDAVDPVVFVTVTWKEATSGGDYFAKLTLEPAGKPTLSHYFEAAGSIEDVWELPEP